MQPGNRKVLVSQGNRYATAVKMVIAPPEAPPKTPSTLPDKVTIPDALPPLSDPFWTRPGRDARPEDQPAVEPTPGGPGGPDGPNKPKRPVK